MSSTRLTLKTKLLGTTALLLLFTAVIAIAGIAGLAAISNNSARIYENATQPLAALGTARADANENRALLNNHILSSDPSAKRTLERKIAVNDRSIDKQLEATRKTLQTDAGKADFAEITSGLRAYEAGRKKVLAVSRQINGGLSPAEANALTNRAAQVNATQARPAFDEVAAGFRKLFDSKVKLGATEEASAHSTFTSERSLMIVLLVLALAIGFAVSFLVSRAIVSQTNQILTTLNSLGDKCVAGLRGALESMARGDLTREVIPVTPLMEDTTNDEIGDIADKVNEIRNGIVGSVVAYTETRASLSAMIGEVAETANTLSAASQQMASTSEEAGKAVGEIAHAVSDVAQGAERQARTVESTRELTEEMSSATQSGAENVAETATAAGQARAVASEGADAVEQATAAMDAVRESSVTVTQTIRHLGEKSEQIGGIVDTITGIAGQTNLLALNAAIEAARAGEQGRGFAVVAEQVRKLAEESQAAAASIAGLISEIQSETARAVEVVEDGAQRTEDGAATVGQAREAFLRIGGSVEDMHGRVDQIATVMQQIAASSTRVQQDMSEVAAIAEESSASSEQVSASTEETSASTEQIAASAQELAHTAEQLEHLCNRFTLATAVTG